MSNEIDLDYEMEPDPVMNRITSEIIGAAIEVHRQLGPGLLESIYENALAIEFNLRKISFVRQSPIDVHYKGQNIGEARLDFVVAERVIVELKSVESLSRIHSAQLIGYLKITGHKLGILINFNVPVLKEGIKRIAN
ncbi:MAG: GxxExxY protein [Phycisphaerales bacterium]|jgi:GxxExxY protein|nr:GxxExxY protein [Phycisphaerales bacterium]